MTINYGPYEPPPPTEPPPYAFEPAGPPAEPPGDSSPAAVGVLLAVLGLGAALIGLFALPIQRYGPEPENATYYGDVRRLVASADDAYLPHVASSLARIWWGTGLVGAVCVLTLLVAATCVADSSQVRRPLGLMTAVTAVVSGLVHWIAMVQTADYSSVVDRLAPSMSLFHASGLGPWIAFMGLAAVAIGALISGLTGRPTAPR